MLTPRSTGPWQPVRKVRAYQQVLAQIEKHITDGVLRPGDQLPSERELSQLLGVSRPSLREALRVLEALGVVEVRGGGPEGGAVLVGTPGLGFANLVRLQLTLGQFSDRDVLQTRLALETWACAEAARHATPADHQRLAALLDKMEDARLEARDFNQLDADFHVAIAESAGNALTAHLMASLRAAMHLRMVDAYERLPDWRESVKTVTREHRELLRSIVEHDPDAAARHVQHHIRSFYNLNSEAEPATTPAR